MNRDILLLDPERGPEFHPIVQFLPQNEWNKEHFPTTGPPFNSLMKWKRCVSNEKENITPEKKKNCKNENPMIKKCDGKGQKLNGQSHSVNGCYTIVGIPEKPARLIVCY